MSITPLQPTVSAKALTELRNMVIREKTSSSHWNYFLALESDLETLSLYEVMRLYRSRIGRIQ